MKTIILIATAFLFIGCTQATKGYISYQGKFCECANDSSSITLFLNKNNSYECKCNNKIITSTPKRIVPIVKQTKIRKYTFDKPSWINIAPIKKCETTITNVYKDGEVRCKGKILEPSQKTRIVRINKKS